MGLYNIERKNVEPKRKRTYLDAAEESKLPDNGDGALALPDHIENLGPYLLLVTSGHNLLIYDTK